MLGEIHCLVNDFPEMKERVEKLIKTNQAFSKLNNQYIELDKEIRQLELKDALISDHEMHSLKQERAQLKDTLYQSLKSEKS